MDPNTYNSNSYVSGVIQKAGGSPPALQTGGAWQGPSSFRVEVALKNRM